MTEDVTIAGDGCRLVLRVAGYERPQLDSGADANWLQAEVELDLEASGGSFQARRSVSLRTNELAAFRDQLAALVETLNGEAVLTHIEEEAGCTIRLKSGVGDLEAFIRDHLTAELRVAEVRTDQSYLQRSLEDMNALVTSFPVRGEPLG